MKSKTELFGAALGKAIRKTTDSMKESGERRAAAANTPALYRINRRNVPVIGDLTAAEGFVDAQVQFLIDKASAGAGHMIGWSVLKPGAQHARHRYRSCDSFFVVLKGKGHIHSDLGEEPCAEGDVVYSPRGSWQGFTNTSDEDAVLIWGVMNAGSIAASGCETESDQQ